MLYFIEDCKLPEGFLESGDVSLLNLGITEAQAAKLIWSYHYEAKTLTLESIMGLAPRLALFGSVKEVGNG